MKMDSEINKLALLIGINEYAYLDEAYQLNGCLNDVESMAKLLKENFGFPEGNIDLLRNEEATKKGIETAFKKLTKKVKKDDVVVIMYSGHGSQRRDRTGYQPSGCSDTIVPYDSGRKDPYENRDIADNEIYEWLIGLTKITPNITMIFDSCHSGTIARDTFGGKARFIKFDDRPAKEMKYSERSADSLRSLVREAGPSGWLPLSKKYVLLSGCMDDESSYEYKPVAGSDVIHGALSYFLIQAITHADAGSTYRDIFEQVSASVTSTYPRQHPQLEGARDREIFDIHDLEPMQFVSIQSRDSETLMMDAGAAQGMTIGSKWAIFPPGTKKATEGVTSLGIAEIFEAASFASKAKIVKESGAITEGCRAVEQTHYYGEMCLKVAIQVSSGYKERANKLEDLIYDVGFLRLIERNEYPDLVVYLLPPREKLKESDPVPQLSSIPRPIWAIVGLDGKLAMPVHEVDEPNVEQIIASNLKKAARYNYALRLTDSVTNNPLRGKVGFKVLREMKNGEWIEAESDAEGRPIYKEGDLIAFQVTNNFDLPLYINVLDFGLSGIVSLIYPPPGSKEPLASDKTFRFGTRVGEEMRLGFPEGLRIPKDPTDKERISCVEALKLFATTDPVDFSILLQPDGYRGVDNRKDIFLENTLSQREEAWTTALVQFSLKQS
jgi:hypothetical protein